MNGIGDTFPAYERFYNFVHEILFSRLGGLELGSGQMFPEVWKISSLSISFIVMHQLQQTAMLKITEPIRTIHKRVRTGEKLEIDNESDYLG